MPFATPKVVYVNVGDRWWRLKPSRIREYAKRITAGASVLSERGLTNYGRFLANRPRGLVDGDASRPILRPRDWTNADWLAALDAMDLRDERFTWGGIQFDIPRAKAIATAAGLEVRQGVPEEDWWAGSRAFIRVLPQRVAEVKQDRPVIFATLVDTDGPFRVLIDGNHRATRAMQKGQEIPYVTLSVRQTLDAMTKSPFIKSIRRRMTAHIKANPR